MKNNNKRILGLLSLLCLMMSIQSCMVAAAEVRDVRLWTAPDHTRVVFDLDRSISYEVFRLHKPERVVVDIKHTKMKKVASLALPDPVIKSIRYGEPKKGVLRIVLDVQKKNIGLRTFLLKPMQGKPHRLVVDLTRKESKLVTQSKKAVKKSSHHEVVIAVDAGHGGEDPGAIGRHGLKEKDFTLRVAKKLAVTILFP